MFIKSTTIAAAAVLALGSGATLAAENLTNGSFETGAAGNASLAMGWLSNAGGYVRESTDVHSGSFAIQLTPPAFNASGTEQNAVKDGLSFNLVVGDKPTLTFWAKGTQGTTGDFGYSLRYLDADGNIKYNSGFPNFGAQLSSTTWKQFSLTGGTVGQAGLAAFVVFNAGMGPIDAANGLLPGVLFLDDVSIQAAVPEASTYAMLLAGLGMVGVMTRRRRQA